MEHALVLKSIGIGIQKVIALGENAGAAGLLWLSAIASAVTDNIPLSAVLAKILSSTPKDSSLWWCVIFGANLGGNITPIGSASTVVAVTLMHKNKISLGFAQFVKQAIPFAIAQLILATVYVLFFL